MHFPWTGQTAFMISHLTNRTKAWASAEWGQGSSICDSFTNFQAALTKPFDPVTSNREQRFFSQNSMRIRSGKNGKLRVIVFSLMWYCISWTGRLAESVMYVVWKMRTYCICMWNVPNWVFWSVEMLFNWEVGVGMGQQGFLGVDFSVWCLGEEQSEKYRAVQISLKPCQMGNQIQTKSSTSIE